MRWMPGYWIHRVHEVKESIERECGVEEDTDPAVDAESNEELNECFVNYLRMDRSQRHFHSSVDDLAIDDEEVAADHEEVAVN